MKTWLICRVIMATTLATGIGSVSAAVLDQDDFNDGDDAGWQRFDPFAGFGAPGAWTLTGGTYRLESPASPMPTVLGPSRAGSIRSGTAYGDARVAVDLVNWDTSHDQAFGLLARLTDVGLGTTDGYAMTYNIGSQEITITRIDNEAAVNLTETAVTILPGNSYRLEFELVGSKLTGRAYNLTNLALPLAVVTWDDTTYSAGLPGLVVFDNTSTNGSPNTLGARGTFDNFEVSSVPEPSSAAVIALVVPALARRRRSRR